jgi:hypothetical protein
MSTIKSATYFLSFPESCGQFFTINDADEGNNPLFLCTDVTTLKSVQSDDVETSTDLKPLDENNENKHEYEYEYEPDNTDEDEYEYEYYEYEFDNTDEDDHDDDSDDDDSDSGRGRSSGSSGGKKFIDLED